MEALWYPEAMPVAWLRCKGGDVEEQIGNIDITAYITVWKCTFKIHEFASSLKEVLEI